MLTLTFNKPGSHMPKVCMRPILAVFFRHVRTQIGDFLLVLQTVTNVVSHNNMLGIYVPGFTFLFKEHRPACVLFLFFINIKRISKG